MNDLNISAEELIALKERYIRILWLPPMTVAEVNFFGESFLPGEEGYFADGDVKTTRLPNGLELPEHFIPGLNAVDRFIKDHDLAEVKPDFRLFGFSNIGEFAPDPEMKKYGVLYGFGRWLTIPDDMTVEIPFTKKRIPGGLYCAYNCPLSCEGQEWEVLNHFVTNDPKYEFDFGRAPACNYGILEEYLNYYSLYALSFKEKEHHIQTDLFMPVKERSK